MKTSSNQDDMYLKPVAAVAEAAEASVKPKRHEEESARRVAEEARHYVARRKTNGLCGTD